MVQRVNPAPRARGGVARVKKVGNTCTVLYKPKIIGEIRYSNKNDSFYSLKNETRRSVLGFRIETPRFI